MTWNHWTILWAWTGARKRTSCASWIESVRSVPNAAAQSAPARHSIFGLQLSTTWIHMLPQSAPKVKLGGSHHRQQTDLSVQQRHPSPNQANALRSALIRRESTILRSHNLTATNYTTIMNHQMSHRYHRLELSAQHSNI